MASRCLGIITFVASARRVWRSIILLRPPRGAGSSGDVRPGTALSASGVARRLAARPKRGRGLYMLALALGFNALEALLVPLRFCP